MYFQNNDLGWGHYWNWLEHPSLYAIHEGIAEFFVDGEVFAADQDLAVADGLEAGDADDIGVVDAGEGGGEQSKLYC